MKPVEWISLKTDLIFRKGAPSGYPVPRSATPVAERMANHPGLRLDRHARSAQTRVNGLCPFRSFHPNTQTQTSWIDGFEGFLQITKHQLKTALAGRYREERRRLGSPAFKPKYTDSDDLAINKRMFIIICSKIF
ncbi:hypothetical protein ACFPMF_19820 [Larkinella bovis]|uniref:Uncharacterized protein n=1 Tax=Larkinella bovis TaxID=683041 RepID=A0ABW0IE69_9BACT